MSSQLAAWLLIGAFLAGGWYFIFTFRRWLVAYRNSRGSAGTNQQVQSRQQSWSLARLLLVIAIWQLAVIYILGTMLTPWG